MRHFPFVGITQCNRSFHPEAVRTSAAEYEIELEYYNTVLLLEQRVWYGRIVGKEMMWNVEMVAKL